MYDADDAANWAYDNWRDKQISGHRLSREEYIEQQKAKGRTVARIIKYGSKVMNKKEYVRYFIAQNN